MRDGLCCLLLSVIAIWIISSVGIAFLSDEVALKQNPKVMQIQQGICFGVVGIVTAISAFISVDPNINNNHLMRQTKLCQRIVELVLFSSCSVGFVSTFVTDATIVPAIFHVINMMFSIARIIPRTCDWVDVHRIAPTVVQPNQVVHFIEAAAADATPPPTPPSPAKSTVVVDISP